MAHIVSSKITLGGYSGITDFFSVNISESLHSHHSFSITLPMHVIEGGAQTLTKAHELIGEKFFVELEDRQKKTYQYDGIITNVHFTKSAPHDMSLSISGTSPTFLLDDHEYSRSSSEKSLNDIVKAVTGDYGDIVAKLDCSAMHSDSIDYSVQYRETAYQYIKRLAAEFGEWFYYNGEKVVFGKLNSKETVKAKLGDGLYSYGFDLVSIPLKDVTKAHDYIKNDNYSSKSQHDKVKGLDPFSKKLVKTAGQMFPNEGNDISNPKYTKKKQVEKQQEILKAGLIGGMQVLTGTSAYHNLHIGTTVDVIGTVMKKESNIEFNVGKYIITDISHTVGREGNYMNNFSAIPESLIHPPGSGIHRKPIAQMQMAIVVDNKDPDKIGRIQVRFPWMDSSEKTPWIRVACPHASGDRGFYFTPEIDDHVMVDFESGDADCPIVISSLYHGKSKPKKWYDKDNNLKAIQTKSGNEFVIDDKPGSESIKIYNPDKKNIITLTMEGKKLIRIESAGDIEMEAKNINLKADNISMKAGQNVKVSSTNFESKASASSKIEGTSSCELKGATAKLEGTASCEVTGAACKVNGDATLDLKGGAMANLSAAMVKIN